MTLTLTKPQLDYALVATKLSALLGRKWGVNIVFGAHPATDGSTIYLPHWNFADPKLIPALYGLIAHEAGGHLRMTDFKLLQSIVENRAKEPEFFLFKSLENLLEDIRIEVNLLRLYPEAKIYLNAAVDYMLCRDWRSAQDCTDYWDLAFQWCLLEFRYTFLGQVCLKEQVEDARAVFQPVVGPDCMAQAMQICADVAALDETLGAFRHVVTSADRLKDLLMRSRPSQSQGSPQASDNGPGAQGGPQASDNGAGAQGGPQASDSGSGAQGGPQASDSGSGAQGGSQASDKPSLSETLPSESKLDVFGDLARAAAHPEFAHKERGKPSLPTLGSVLAATTNVHQQANVETLLRQATPLVQGLFSALAPMLCGEMDYQISLRAGTKLDGRRIARAVAEAEPAVFKRVVVVDDQSVAVQVLVDRSTSTKGSVLEEEIKAAIGLTSAIERFPEVEAAVSFFPAEKAQGGTARGTRLVKDFSEPLRGTLKRWPTAEGGTPLHSAYVTAGLDFLRSTKQRRILIVLTDGKPSDVPQAIEAKRFLAALDVDVYGIVIGSLRDYPLELFDDSEHAENAVAVTQAMRNLVRRIL